MGRVKKAVFKFQPFSKKQKQILTWWLPESGVSHHRGIIADGAIRSGKTIPMSLSFVMWAMTSFDEQTFAMCGKTIGAFRRNVLTVLKRMLSSRGYKVRDFRQDNLIVISRNGVTNYFYVFGGKDERSQDLIQGITLAGAYFDEVALMPESFVNQATARCSVDGSKLWFNCNPQGPHHWFKVNWIDKSVGYLGKEKAAKLQEKGEGVKDFLYLHFTMDDNLSLSDRIKAAYRQMYIGVFFKRYILGLWCAAEGAIYSQFADDPQKYTVTLWEESERRRLCERMMFISIGIDFGGNRSKTTFVASGFEFGFQSVIALKDYAIPGRKGEIDGEKVNREFIAFYRSVEKEYPHVPIRYVFADNEAQYLINSLYKACRRVGITADIKDAAKNEIVQRIYCGNTLLNSGRMLISDMCTLLPAGLAAAVWDQKAAENGKDVRLDNFSSDIDILDAWEYSWERFMSMLLPQEARR